MEIYQIVCNSVQIFSLDIRIVKRYIHALHTNTAEATSVIRLVKFNK